MIKIQARDLHRMCYNATLFSSRDSQLEGVTIWGVSNGYLSVYASDDHVVLRDATRMDLEPLSFGLSLKTLKDTEKDLRDDATGVIDWEPETVDYDDLIATAVVEIVEDSEWHPNQPAERYDIRPTRYAKFGRLKTPGDLEYPLSWIQGRTPYDRVVQMFKCGPYIRGVLATLDREYIEQYFGEERHDVLW